MFSNTPSHFGCEGINIIQKDSTFASLFTIISNLKFLKP